jgi:twinkle protein
MSFSDRFKILGIDLKNIKTTGKTFCPKCSADRKNKTDRCLSVDIQEGVYNCHNCGWAGSVKPKREEKTYVRPVFNNRTELSDGLTKWFQGRGISQQTLLEMKITEGPEFMPQTSKEENTCQFNYFEDGKLINTKFRDARKNFKMVKDAELVFYNLDGIKDSDWCIITEGEIDALSWVEAGIKEVVSVPNGASKGNQRLDYLDNCYEYFLDKTKIYLATDNDEPGKILRDELSRRLGIEKCFWLDFGNCKDSNEYLVSYGADKLKNLLTTANEFAIDGLFTIDDVWGDLVDFYENGLPSGDKTGDAQFDAHLGIMSGELTAVTGIPGHGKTIYLDQISLGLCLNAGWLFGVCSPESYPLAFYYSRLIKRLLGCKFSKNNISESMLMQAKEWIKDRFNLIAPTQGYDLDDILDKARILVLRKGIKGLIIDPWNRIESTMPSGYSPIKFVQERLDKLVRFAQVNKVHIFLVAHPVKMQKEKDGIDFLVPNLYSISGSSDFFNMCQNGFTVYKRNSSGKTEIHIQKVKWDHLGKVGMIEYNYCPDNTRFYVDGENPYQNWLHPEIDRFVMPQSKEFDHPDFKIQPLRDDELVF